MLHRWDELYPQTSHVADPFGDEIALQELQTVHNLDYDEIEEIVNGIGESGKIKFWKRPKNLTRRKSGSDDEPYVWQEIRSEIAIETPTTSYGFAPDFDFVADSRRWEEAWNAATN